MRSSVLVTRKKTKTHEESEQDSSDAEGEMEEDNEENEDDEDEDSSAEMNNEDVESKCEFCYIPVFPQGLCKVKKIVTIRDNFGRGRCVQVSLGKENISKIVLF